jgi:hypothetical protein
MHEPPTNRRQGEWAGRLAVTVKAKRRNRQAPRPLTLSKRKRPTAHQQANQSNQTNPRSNMAITSSANWV